jgi:hypothetical protein
VDPRKVIQEKPGDARTCAPVLVWLKAKHFDVYTELCQRKEEVTAIAPALAFEMDCSEQARDEARKKLHSLQTYEKLAAKFDRSEEEAETEPSISQWYANLVEKYD